MKWLELVEQYNARRHAECIGREEAEILIKRTAYTSGIEDLESVLVLLPPDEAEAIRLHLQGLTNLQISMRAYCDESTVTDKIKRAWRRLSLRLLSDARLMARAAAAPSKPPFR